jgi:hypothetical protein
MNYVMSADGSTSRDPVYICAHELKRERPFTIPALHVRRGMPFNGPINGSVGSDEWS